MDATVRFSRKLKERAKQLRGLQTIDSAMRTLNVSRPNAVRIVYELRKRGLARTIAGGRKKRIYRISLIPEPETANSLYAYLSKKSRIPLQAATERIIHTAITPEIALIEALKDNDFRVWLAGTALYRYIEDWKSLANKALTEHLGRVVGAFYDATRRVIRVRKMPERTRKQLLKDAPTQRFQRVTENRDFADIEEEWSVSIPFGKADLERLK